MKKLETHPAADLFPMMDEEELADLIADIKANGLLDPIVLYEGKILDGRNRNLACELAGVGPRYVDYEGNDPVGYAVSVNVNRRMLSKGQRAMIAARAERLVTSRRSNSALAKASGVSRARINQANVILDHADELADAVSSGASLDQAYDIARLRKREADEQKKALETLEADWPDFAARIESGEWTAAQALAAVQAAQRQAREEAAREQVTEQINLAIERIGPEVQLPAAPELSLSLKGDEDVPSTTPDLDTLAERKRLLDRLIGIKRELQNIADELPQIEGWWPEQHVTAVRSAVSQIVTNAYRIAEAHNAAYEDRQTIRRVK